MYGYSSVAGERLCRNKLTLTQAGRDVLSGTRDWPSLRPPSRWVGGVHVAPGLPGWRWDEATCLLHPDCDRVAEY